MTPFRGRGRGVLLSALAVAGLVAVVILLPQLVTRLSRQPGSAPPAATDQVVGVEDLRGIDDLSAAFEEDTGHVRVVLLLSPT